MATSLDLEDWLSVVASQRFQLHLELAADMFDWVDLCVLSHRCKAVPRYALAIAFWPHNCWHWTGSVPSGPIWKLL